MFSFHKPKIYRSLKGCCICRAKSSSSRFTDSKRYEPDFDKCFKIVEDRCGEICNACVLLVKRWKKLPVGSNRNWHHVVDARAGPGTKSIMKMKKSNKDDVKIKHKKHKHKKQRQNKPPNSPGGLSDDVVIGDEFHSDHSNSHSTSSSPVPSDYSDDEGGERKEQGSKGRRKKNKSPVRFSSFLDLTYWKSTEICCGIIFKGPNGEVMVDPSLLRPCRTCKPTPPVSPPPCSEDSQEQPLTDSQEENTPPLDHQKNMDLTPAQIAEAELVLDLSLPAVKASPVPFQQQGPLCIPMEV